MGKLAAGLTLGAGLIGGLSGFEELAKGTVEATQNAQTFQAQLATPPKPAKQRAVIDSDAVTSAGFVHHALSI